MSDLAKITARHVEKKSWPLFTDQQGIEADGYRHWCGYCKFKWPCDAAVLLALLRTEPVR